VSLAPHDRTTEDGIVGWSEYDEHQGATGVTSVVERLTASVVGERVQDTGRVFAKRHARARQSMSGGMAMGIGAIENALLDAKAKLLGVPCCELLGGRVRDLLQSIDNPVFTGIFDFANFVVCGEQPYRCWQQVRPWITYFHVKDAVAATGTVVPAGDGDGAVARILGEAYEAGFDSFLTLEPHLNVAAANFGRPSPARFKVAADALESVLAAIATATP